MAQEHRSTQRALDILELLAFGDNSSGCIPTEIVKNGNHVTGFTLTEIATKLHVPKSSISPIIHTLTANRYLKYDSDTARYCIGRRTFEIGNTYIKNDVFYSQAISIMQNIVHQCSETCHLGELQGRDIQYLMKVESPGPITMTSTPGKRLPANCTALGKALLCEYTFEELKDLFDGQLIGLTEHSVVDLDVLYQQLQEVRRTGIAQEKEENYEFVQCVATPIYKNGKPVQALSVSFPTFHYTQEKEQQIETLLLDAKKSLELII